MRTVNQPAEIRRKAPLQSIRDASVTTGLSMCFLRSGCKDGTVPHVMAGGKYMINVPALYRILNVPVGGESADE